MEIFNIMEIAKSSEKNKIPFISEKLMIGLFSFEPGQERPLHKSEYSDAFIYIIEGRVLMTVGERQGEVKAGELVIAPANTLNGFKCIEKTVAIGGAAPSPQGYKKNI